MGRENLSNANICPGFMQIFSLCTHMEIRWLKLGKLYHARKNNSQCWSECVARGRMRNTIIIICKTN